MHSQLAQSQLGLLAGGSFVWYCTELICNMFLQNWHLVTLILNWSMVLQLLNWYKRRHNPVEGCRLYRLAPQCSAAPTYLVLKAVLQPQLSSLDPRGVFAAHCSDHLYIWQVSVTVPSLLIEGCWTHCLKLYEASWTPCSSLQPLFCTSVLNSSRLVPVYQ